MADSSKIPSWAVAAKGSAATDTPQPDPQNPTTPSGGGNMVSNAISGVKNFIEGLFGKKSAPAEPTTQSNSKVPSWAVAAGSSSSTPSTTPKNPTAPKSQVPSWAVSKPTPQSTPDGPIGPSKIGDISGAETAPSITSPMGDLTSANTESDTSTSDTTRSDEFTPSGAISSIGPSDFATGAVTAAKDLAQFMPKVAASVGPLVAQAAQALTHYGQPSPSAEMSIPLPSYLQGLLGEKEIDSPAAEIDKIRTAIQNSPIAQKLGLDKFATQLGFAGILGQDALAFEDFSTGEGLSAMSGRDAVITALQNANSVDDVLPILEKIKMNPSIAEDLAPYLANMTDAGDISDALDLAQTLNRGISALPDIEDINDSAAGDTGKSTYSQGAIGAAEDTIKTTYAGVPAESVDEAATNIMTEMDLSTAGSRLITGTRADRTVTGIPSTFPKWVPENLRSKDLFTKVFDYIDPSSEKFGTFPPANRPKQRALVYELFNELDSRLGVDTSGSRNDIFSEYNDYDESKKGESAKTRGGSPQGGEIDVDEAADKFGSSDAGPDTESDSVKQDVGNAATVIHPGDPAPEPGKIPTVSQMKAQLPNDETSRIQSIKDIMRGRYEESKATGSNKSEDPSIPVAAVTESDQRSSVMEAYNGGIEKGTFKGWRPETAKAVLDFVNTRSEDNQAATGHLIAMQFDGLRPDGADAYLKYDGFMRDPERGQIVKDPNGPNREGLYGKVAKTFADALNTEQEAGVPVKEKQNYFPIAIKDSKTGATFIDGEEVPVKGRRVGLRPGFTLPSTFKTMTEAIQAGYTPLFGEMPDAIASRIGAGQRAIANARLNTYLAESGNLVPANLVKDKSRMATYDPDRYPRPRGVQYKDTQGVINHYHDTYMGPKPIVDFINNYLKEPNETLKKVAGTFTSLKNFALSVGIPDISQLPGIGKFLPSPSITLHYWNILARDIIGDVSRMDVKGVGKIMWYGIDSRSAARTVERLLPTTGIKLIRAGMTFSAEDHKLSLPDMAGQTAMEKAGSIGKYVSNTLHQYFAKGIFSRIIPARKMEVGAQLVEKFMKAGADEDSAYKTAAGIVNQIYGGINLDALGRNKNFQNAMRIAALSPDFAESTGRILANTLSSFGSLFKQPKEGAEGMEAGSVKSKIYRNFALAFIGAYVGANILNKEKTGKWMWDNDPLNQLSVAWGTDSQGRTRYVKPFGTGFDFFRLPMQVAAAIAQNKPNDVEAIIRDRFSIPAASMFSLFTNTDWSGQKIWGPDIFGNPQSTSKVLSNVFNNTLGTLAPSSVTSAENLVSGVTSPEQSVIQGLGLPVGYVNEKPNDTTIKQLEADAKTGIANGDYTLYNQLVKAKVISSRSRATFVRDALTAGGKTAKQLKESVKEKARLAAEEKALQNEGFSK